MTAKEKAEELFKKFYPDYYDNGQFHKKVITKRICNDLVDEIVSSLETAVDFDYWLSVKTEIEKL